ncbi:MAG: permease [Acidobacteria bacterium]|nr:MAG: permease [Acidobacteriota bacterium]
MLAQDLRYAVRTLRQSPGFTVIATLTVAIGVGANTAIFSIVNAVLLRPLPFPRAEELLLVTQTDRQTKQVLGTGSPANFLDWRVRNRAFAGMAGFEGISLILSDGDHPERLDGAMVNVNFFDVLEVAPAIGRSFGEADERPGAPRVAVLSDGSWRMRFAGRSDVIGRTVHFNGEATTIIGVMPPEVAYPERAEVWVPPHWRVPDDPLLGPAQDPSTERTHSYFFVVGRLKPGVSMAAAQADMDAVALGLERDFPNDNQNAGVNLVSLRSDLVADVRPMVMLLFAAVGLVLMIATANVSGLLVARASARHQEIALRMALGATRGRILVQLLTESVLLASLGGAFGVLLAMWLVGLLVALSPSSLTIAGDIRIDVPVLLFALVVSMAAGVLFGLAPARQLSRVDVHDDLKQSARGGSASGQRRLRAGLVASEIAISLVLLIAAGLTIRSFIRLQDVPVGFDPDHVVTVTLNPPAARYPTPRNRADFYERTLDALGMLPGVEIAGATSRLPLLPGNSRRGLNIPGVPSNEPTDANYRTATPSYFRAMDIPLIRGRVFTDADREDRPLVAVISASLAQRFWANQDPIGKQFSIDQPPITIVGIVGDVHAASLEAPVEPTVYVPYRQDAFPFMTFVVRTRSADASRSIDSSTSTDRSVQASVRLAIWRVDKELPIGAVRTMDDELSSSVSRRRFGVTLLTAFGAIAVTLSAIGLYGVLAFIVAQRRREIGVRIALGARPGDLVADVLGQGLRLTAIGVVVGLVLAIATTRLINSLLFATSPTDMLTFAAVSSLLVVVAAAASLLPALRASRVDALIALRDE